MLNGLNCCWATSSLFFGKLVLVFVLGVSVCKFCLLFLCFLTFSFADLFRSVDVNISFTLVAGLLFRGSKMLRLTTRYASCLFLTYVTLHVAVCIHFHSFSHRYATFIKLIQYFFLFATVIIAISSLNIAVKIATIC